MNQSASPETENVFLHAPAYGLLLGQTTCHFCHALTPTAAVWVPSFEERDEEGVMDHGEGALLRYIEQLDESATAFIIGHAAWLRYASTRTSGSLCSSMRAISASVKVIGCSWWARGTRPVWC